MRGLHFVLAVALIYGNTDETAWLMRWTWQADSGDRACGQNRIRRDQMKCAIAAVMASVAFFSILGRAQGSALYTIESNAKLYQVSQTTGVATLIGTTSPVDTADLASDTRPGSYRLWTTNLSRQLVSINPATGAGTVVGAFDPVNFLRMRTLAFDITNGKLYGTNSDSLSK